MSYVVASPEYVATAATVYPVRPGAPVAPRG